MCRQGHWSARWPRRLREAQVETLGDTLGDVETRIMVKTLDFKGEVATEALVQTVLYTLVNAEATILQDTRGGV